jgi:pilus assembly protein CpaE
MALAERLKAGALLADLDLEFGGVARAWDLSATYSIADIAGAGMVDALLLKKATCELPLGISVLSRPAKIEEAHAIEESMIGLTIQCARAMYPFVILDLPRKLDAIVGTALEQCNKTLIITQATVPAVDNAKRMADALGRAGMEYEKFEFVLNRHRKNIHTITPEVIEKTLGKKLFGVIPNDYHAVSKAIDLGTPMSGRNPVYCAITELALKLAGRSQPQQRRGWLSRWTSAKKKAVAAR